jgi:hypothetical protein
MATRALVACYAGPTTATAKTATDHEVIPADWREHYADLAAAWVREKGTLPPSLKALADWAAEPLDIPLDAEIAFLEGRGPDPDPCR